MHFEREITLLSFLMSFFIRFCKGGCSETLHFDKIRFKKFGVGKVIQTIFVEDDLRCVSNCSRFPECLSFNIAAQPKQDGLFECVLLSELVVYSSILLTVSQIYHHYSRRIGLGMCFTPRCKNGGICITQLTDYRCLCLQRFTDKHCENLPCSSALGMKNGAIADRQLSASSKFSENLKPARGRLRNTKFWASSALNTNQWFQVDLGNVTKVTGIATQGAPTIWQWVKSYSLQYSTDSSTYEDYEGGKIFTANSDQNAVVKNDVNPAIIARYIRVRPKTWQTHIVMRMELYGCN